MHLRKHGLAETPDGAHHLARVARIRLADRDQHQVVEDAFGRHAHVADFGNLHAHQRQENPLDGLAHVEIFHGRRADDGGRVDGIAALGDAGDVEDRVLIGERIVAGVVAERTFGAEFAQFDVAFEHDFGIRGHFEIDRLALHHFDGAAAQEAGDHHLIQIGWKGKDGGIHGGGIGADGDGHVHARRFFPRLRRRR